LKSAGILNEKDDYTADGLLRLFHRKVIAHPQAGALLFTLNHAGKAVHVVICLDRYFQIGASGGTRRTVDLAASWRDNAYVKIRPIRFKPERMRIVNPFARE
jgi:hypothetical protein